MAKRDVIKQIKRNTRRKFTADQKIQIVLEGLRGEISVSELCRREGIAPTMYYKWSKAFLEAGKNGLTRDTRRDATGDEVRRLKQENVYLKQALAESVLDVQRFKKSLGM
jgi:transposase